jgi:hypothetical protein
MADPKPRTPFFGPLPTVGLWTALGLTRGQFLTITVGSVALFVFVGGPVWNHVRDRHFERLAWSYAAIPLGVAWALHHNRTAGRLGQLVASSGVIGLLKLVVTALLLALLGIGR